MSSDVCTCGLTCWRSCRACWTPFPQHVPRRAPLAVLSRGRGDSGTALAHAERGLRRRGVVAAPSRQPHEDAAMAS
ncbi:hypothetical protein PsYK624_119990 [Phanerochaete sordida]|uniref:Uncharacterized protein n=1 Tax=Phanerochaete sordida TaxID=48140 RepID=A0A9P3GLT4_9APHY|nr:hypothetical protein PsYK624_119990 [Phanerochaete sordida]